MNSKDREEYRLAALAAGYEITFEHGILQRIEMFRYQLPNYEDWDPVTDKADNFDLMVDCNIVAGVSKTNNLALASNPCADEEIDFKVEGNGDSAANLMQAIFKCAVDMGRLMETQDNEQMQDRNC